MTRQEILNEAAGLANKLGRLPTQIELEGIGVTRAVMRSQFGNMESFRRHLIKLTENVFDLDYSKVNTSHSKKKRFVITTAVVGAKVDKDFYKNLKAYCKAFDAELQVMVSLNNSKDAKSLDPILQDDVIVIEDRNLNDSVFLLGIRNSAKSADPITGLPRVGQRNGTFITASPKQRLKMVPTGQSKLPHALMSTGAITYPNYIHSRILVDKNSYLAESDHVMGAVIVEIENSTIFHFRQIQADANGAFVDLGAYVNNGKVSSMAPAAFVLGDWHSGETDPVVAKCWEEISDALRVKAWVIHDGFDGKSISHHDEGKLLTLARKAEEDKLSLEAELDGYVADVTKMANKREVIMVMSNHDDFLTRYLNEGRYVAHPHNHRIALDLAAAYLDGLNPLEFYYHNQVKKTKHDVTWLQRDESYKIAGIELGAHGDKGANGARGSARSMEQAYGACVYGHTHTPEISREAWCVGTSTHLQLDYNVGASSWVNTSCLVYPNGQRQLINVIDGRYTTRKL